MLLDSIVLCRTGPVLGGGGEFVVTLGYRKTGGTVVSNCQLMYKSPVTRILHLSKTV